MKTLPENFRSIFENPEIINQNMLKPHSYMIPFENEESALKNDKTYNPFYQSLNGVWQFLYYDEYSSVLENFEKSPIIGKEIEVPCSWQMPEFLSQLRCREPLCF